MTFSLRGKSCRASQGLVLYRWTKPWEEGKGTLHKRGISHTLTRREKVSRRAQVCDLDKNVCVCGSETEKSFMTGQPSAIVVPGSVCRAAVSIQQSFKGSLWPKGSQTMVAETLLKASGKGAVQLPSFFLPFFLALPRGRSSSIPTSHVPFGESTAIPSLGANQEN